MEKNYLSNRQPLRNGKLNSLLTPKSPILEERGVGPTSQRPNLLRETAYQLLYIAIDLRELGILSTLL